ncbi:MAG: DUF2442 domain-containing protein, partial [Chloroflexi bacterium]|nr:DUF2442 domain-containing protein [Chloroflexota bacterium]
MLRVEGFRFFFFPFDCTEPIHVHVGRGGGLAKVWVMRLSIAKSVEVLMINPFLSASSAQIDSETRTVLIALEDGRVYRTSLSVSSRLRLVDAELLEQWEWIGPRAGIHWPAVDEDLSVEFLVANGAE